MTSRPLRLALLAVSLLLSPSLSAIAATDEPTLSSGQTLYLPVYSHVYHGEVGKDGRPAQTLVSTHVSIRNTDPQQPIRVLSARYYDTQGRLVRSYLATPISIPPLGTYELFVARSDTAGGSGANFIIAWNSEAPANPPLVEALHADIREARTLMFVTAATPIRPR